MSDDRSLDLTSISLPTRVDIHSDTKTADRSIEGSSGHCVYDYTDDQSQVTFTMQAGQEEPAKDGNWHLRDASYNGSLAALQRETMPTLKYKIVKLKAGTEDAGMTNGNGSLSNGSNGLV